MRYLRNPFPIVNESINLRDYESQINQAMEKFFNNFFRIYEILSFKKVMISFWELVDNTRSFNPLDWYDTFAVFILRVFTTQILLDEGRILQETRDIFINWFLYLARRIMPNQNYLSNNFLNILYTDELIPIPDFEAAGSLLEENIDLIQNYDYPNILSDDTVPIVQRLRIFRVFFVGYYELFKRKCVFIENFLYIAESRARPLQDIRDIFQLYNNNNRTPPELPREALKVLIHIRNSGTHRNMTVLTDGSIRIRDYNNKNELTYENNRSIVQMHEYYHALLVMDKIFDAIALAIMLKRRIEDLYIFYGKFIQCPDCGTTNKYCILPNMILIICKTCRFPVGL
ncbi:hypothetical protein LCGC14_0498260 [marine sediment metagenome]|uniref:Uncharacterized protein n=1 Tax=marine sediment metagenome TaxID=412755 RepID=A0A0F9SN82_9ZZZZ|nr:hypothetical protein [bacterium]